jgi:starch phosphorylase
LRELFPKIRVTEVRVSDLSSVRVGESVEVRLELDLGELAPSEVTVELVLGHARPGGAPDLVGGIAEPLRRIDGGQGQTHVYEGGHKVERSGAFAYGLRIRASAALGDPSDSLRELVRWVG